MCKFQHVASAAVFSVWALSVLGATNYWDNNGASAGFGDAGGTWGVDSLWSTDRTGATAPGVTTTTADDDVYFGLLGTGLGGGTVSVDAAGQTFRSMRFGSASGPITVAGGDLSLGAPVTRVAGYNVSNTLASALSSTNSLQKYRPPTLVYSNFLMLASTVVFSNATLSDYVAAGCVMNGSSIPIRTAANAYRFVHSVTSATFQAQAVDGAYTKCVKVELTQVGPDIAARPVYAKYIGGSQPGIDFDTTGTVNSIATNAATGGYGVAQLALYASPENYVPFLTATFSNIVANASLADCVGATASLGGGSVSGSGSTVPMAPYYFVNNGSNATVQFQAFNGGYTKCVKVELAQSGPHIAARALYAKYYNANGVNMLGFDFDTGGAGATVATAFNTGNYGAWEINLNMARPLTLSGVNTYAGDTLIDWGRLEVGGSGQLGSGSYTGAIANAGQLLCNSTAGQTFYGAISGSGSLVKDSPARSASTATYSSFLTATPTVILYGESLLNCAGADGIMDGSYVAGGPVPADAYFFVNNGAVATYQLQATNDVYTKCVKVELTQVGPNIAARAVYAKYVNGAQLGYNFDAGGNPGTISTSHTEGGYGAAETTLSLSSYSKLILAGTNNTYTGGTTVNRGALEATSANALPSKGAITVNADGELVLKSAALNVGNTGGVGNGNPITVNAGGKLTLSGVFNAGYSRLLTINGGTLNFAITENNDGANYVNNLALLSGAQVTGYKVRVGYLSSAVLTVSGSSPCSVPAGFNMVKSGAYTMTFNVADVTGSGAADLLIQGVIRDYDSSGFAGMPIIKTGAGTLSLSGANTHTGLITVAAGTLALDANNTLNTGNPIALGGGTLAMGAYTNSAGTLAVTTNSAIALGTGQLAFAASSGQAWSGGLTLTGTLDRYTLRVGTDATALTPQQIALIRYENKPVRIRSDGYLSPYSKGILISLR
jgi:autotransporter-associated beta strand protein